VKIRAISKEEFDRIMREGKLDDTNIESRSDLWLVSINPAPDMFKDAYLSSHSMEPYFKEEHPQLLKLFFDDVPADTPYTVLGTKKSTIARAMTQEQAEIALDFLEKMKGKDGVLLVHCTMGKSRSVAVAHFAAELLGQNPKDIYENESQDPNKTTLRLLREAKEKRK
jgi:protein-tyrosine phosphatase